MKINKENQRGKGNYGWLNANYSFSFSQYFNPDKMGFNSLRVINEDFIAAKAGFPKHGHKNMEILTFIIKGELGHTDSLGNIQTLRPGQFQRMYAGSGISHSEFNAGQGELNLMQIWVEPNVINLAPEYNEKEFNFKNDGETLLASSSGRDNSIKIYQNIEVSVLNLSPGSEFKLAKLYDYYAHVIKGSASVGINKLNYGDSLESMKEEINIISEAETSILIFKFL